MKIYLGLGSNLGDRKNQLEKAIARLKELLNCSTLRVSPLYQTPALLLPGADPTWNKPFLNLALELESDVLPEDLLACVQKVEAEAGRTRHSKWAPRELDVDLLLYGDKEIQTPNLTVPHAELKKRAFALDPLKDLNPSLRFPGESRSVLNLARSHLQHAPTWMGILNVTPDSFSDGGVFSSESAIQNEIQNLEESHVGIIDIGGESTRPGAEPVTPAEEWERVKPVLRFLNDRFRNQHIRPLVSLDTRHFETAQKAMEYEIDFLNDVSGLADLRLGNLLKGHRCSYILTHSLCVPADPKHVLAENADVITEIKNWFTEKIESLQAQGIQKERIVLDPGIGFGKTSLQSLIILQNIDQFFSLELPILVGHSRKSFLNPLSSSIPQKRDQESIGVSLAMIHKGVDILRVHNPSLHMQAFQGWSHVRSPI